tara:strand:- start:3889 stop:4152 length:264 start_codon:yes stop_codon:yes gene_type:complete
MEVAASPDTVTTVPTSWWGFQVETDKTNDVTLTIGNGATEVVKHIVTGTTDSQINIFPKPVALDKGLIVTLAGTASKCVIFYSQDNI